MNRITGKHWVALWLCLMAFVGMRAQNATDSLQHEVLIETTMGRVRVTLYNDTPKHRDNFLETGARGLLRWLVVSPRYSGLHDSGGRLGFASCRA